MRKNYLKALLLGAVVTASAGTFVSCNYDDDIDELKNRITVVEGLITELKAAVENGLSITSATQTDGVWTLVLSDGSKIVCGGGAGGGSVTVVENADNIVITVDGKEYTLPKGAAAASLIYRPKFVDGKEMIADMKSIPVSFLISGDVFDASKITEAAIVDAYALTTRAASSLFEVVEGSATVNENVVTVSIKAGESAEASKTYNVNVRIKVGSKEYISNYFQIEMGDAFSYDNAAPQDQIDAFAAADGMNATVDADGAAKLLVFADELPTMSGEVDFAKYFKGLPEGAKFIIGAQATEEGSKAFDALRNSMGADGKFKWAQRPGTAFPDGFRVTIQNKESQTIGKADFKYTDPLAAVDFYNNGLPGNFEAEYGGRDFVGLQMGKQTIDVQEAFNNYAEKIPIRHGGSDDWFAAWAKYSIKDANGNELIFNDGTELKASEDVLKLVTVSRGICWFFRGLTVNVPENIFPEGWVGPDGKTYSAGEGAGFDQWRGDHNEYASKSAADFYGDWSKFGFSIDEKTGKFSTDDTYTGWCSRIAFSAMFEYDYGVKPLCGNGTDQLGMLFFNRRLAPEGTTIPADRIFQ